MKKDGTTIRVYGGNLKGAIRAFMRKTKQSGILGELRRSREFVPNNEKRRMKAWRNERRQNRARAR